MKEFFSSIKFKIILVILALLLGITLFAATTTDGKTFLSSVIGGIISPFQKLSMNISQSVTSTVDMLTNADKYYAENEELKEEIESLYSQIAEYDLIKSENENLRKILELKEKYVNYQFSPPCQVIGRVTNNPYKAFFIDKGTLHDVALYDPVVTTTGLVGIVDSVELTYSRVVPVLSPEFPMGVFETKTKDTGILEGGFDLAEENLTLMKFINKESEIQVGGIIVTSGHSGLVPANSVVGIVKEINISQNGLSKEAIIEPIVDINAIKNVFVITDFEGQGEGYE